MAHGQGIIFPLPVLTFSAGSERRRIRRALIALRGGLLPQLS